MTCEHRETGTNYEGVHLNVKPGDERHINKLNTIIVLIINMACSNQECSCVMVILQKQTLVIAQCSQCSYNHREMYD